MKFNVITAWEVLEHIKEHDLQELFKNIKNHLSDDGIFVGSVAMTEDVDPVTGAIYHVTVKPREWWHEKIESFGFKLIDGMFETMDYVRGSGNIRANGMDWDAAVNPEFGFHVVCKIK